MEAETSLVEQRAEARGSRRGGGGGGGGYLGVDLESLLEVGLPVSAKLRQISVARPWLMGMWRVGGAETEVQIRLWCCFGGGGT